MHLQENPFNPFSPERNSLSAVWLHIFCAKSTYWSILQLNHNLQDKSQLSLIFEVFFVLKSVLLKGRVLDNLIKFKAFLLTRHRNAQKKNMQLLAMVFIPNIPFNLFACDKAWLKGCLSAT